MGSNDADNLNQQMENIVNEADALMAAMSRARAIRLVLFVAVVAFVLVTVLKFYQLAAPYQGEDNQKVLLAQVTDQWNKNSDKYTNQVKALVDKCSPALTNAFYDQAKKDLPAYSRAAEAEFDRLVTNLENQLTDKLTIHHQDAEGKQKRMLQQEFPELKDEKVMSQMMVNMEKAVNQLVKKYYIQELHDELLAFKKTWDDFPAAKPVKGEEPLEDQFIANLLLVLQDRLAHTDAVGGIR